MTEIEELVEGAPDIYPFRAETSGISVEVCPVYDENTGEDQGEHAWVYFVRIENHSKTKVTLKSRYWRIIDANGMLEEVHGAGVVGETPTIAPGESFEYDSFIMLETPSGFMEGFYDLTAEDGQRFQVDIPAFPLDVPGTMHVLN